MLNHIVIMGRMVRDPELRRTGSGIAVAGFSVAVERDFPSKEGGEKETDFFDCVAWRQTGEFVGKYFRKGRMITVSGRLQTRSWTDKDGNKRRATEIVADNVYFADSKTESTPAAPSQNAASFAYPAPGYSAPSYGAPAYPMQGYSAPTNPASDFQMLEDDDAQLPF